MAKAKRNRDDAAVDGLAYAIDTTTRTPGEQTLAFSFDLFSVSKKVKMPFSVAQFNLFFM